MNRAQLFRGDHFLGKPADFTHRIVRRRVALVRRFPDFTGTSYDLLDIGCGNGASMFLLSEDMKYCLGLDTEASHMEAFEQFRKNHNIQNCEFRVFDIEHQKLERQFDRIVSFEVIEHLRSERSVEWYYTALRSGGIMAITVPNKWWFFETHGMKIPGFHHRRTPLGSWLPQALHERYSNARIYTLSRIVRLLQSAGFVVERTHYITAPLDVLREGKSKQILEQYIFTGDTTTIPFLSTSIMVICRKPT